MVSIANTPRLMPISRVVSHQVRRIRPVREGEKAMRVIPKKGSVVRMLRAIQQILSSAFV
jgi:hypothetical protein